MDIREPSISTRIKPIIALQLEESIGESVEVTEEVLSSLHRRQLKHTGEVSALQVRAGVLDN